jgi:arginase
MSYHKKNQYLFFPQWQGGNDQLLHEGAKELYQLLGDFPFEEVSVATSISEEAHHIKGYENLLNHFQEAKKLIDQAAPEKIYTLGGDCGVDLAPVSYLNERYNGELLLIWLDAHADFNTPESSPSGEFHGMVLRTITGEGNPALTDYLKVPIRHEQLCMVGVREMDRPERLSIAENNITQVHVDQANQSFRHLIDPLFASGLENVYVHIDLDVLDPGEFNSALFQIDHGLGWSVLTEFIQLLHEQFNVVGGSILEYVPGPTEAQKKAAELARILFR